MRPFSSRLASALALALLSTSALADPSTGAYCNTQIDKIISYYCNGTGNPGGWNGPDGNGCYAKENAQTCSSLADSNPVFDDHQYGVLNPDVAQNGINRLQHWKLYGKAEGRPSSFGFKVQEYVNEQANGDIKNAYGTNWPAAIDNYAKYGLFGKRPGRDRAYWFNPDWTVYIDSKGAVNAPADGSYHFVIARSGEGSLNNGNYSTNTPIQTGFTTSWWTGMESPRANGQFFGPYGQDLIDRARGFTGVQRFGEQFGLAIDTRSNTANINAFARSMSPPAPATSAIIVNRLFPNRRLEAFQAGQQGLRTAFELRMPQAGGTGDLTTNGGVNMSSFYYLYDRNDEVRVQQERAAGKQNIKPVRGLYIGASIYDSRAGVLGPAMTALIDVNTNSLIAGAALRKNSPFMTVDPVSAEAADGPNQTFTNARPYLYEVSPAQLQASIREAKRQVISGGTQADRDLAATYSENPADYIVESWNLNPEVFFTRNANLDKVTDGWIGVSGRILQTGAK